MGRAIVCPRSYQSRHPELVSGSIAPNAHATREDSGGAASLPERASVAAEKWTLKQVQGDEE